MTKKKLNVKRVQKYMAFRCLVNNRFLLKAKAIEENPQIARMVPEMRTRNPEGRVLRSSWFRANRASAPLPFFKKKFHCQKCQKNQTNGPIHKR